MDHNSSNDNRTRKGCNPFYFHFLLRSLHFHFKLTDGVREYKFAILHSPFTKLSTEHNTACIEKPNKHSYRILL